MKNEKVYEIYIVEKKKFIKVTKEQYYAYYRPIWAICRKAKRHGQCICPKEEMLSCDGNCIECKYKREGDTVSLNNIVKDDFGSDIELGNVIKSDSKNPTEILEEKELKNELYEFIKNLNEQDKRICLLVMEGYSSSEIAKRLNMPRKTFTYRRDKLFEEFRKKFQNFF